MRHRKDNFRVGSLYVGGPVSQGAAATSQNVSESMWQRILRLTSERRFVIGVILVMALVAFEMFNFDTTRFALANLFGEASFMGLRWATILAIAFCAIDFAGLGYLFAPERAGQERKEIWYLMGAWLLGATMNALMTWWAVSVTILGQDVGNEIVGRAQLIEAVPAFVAALVWLTRILFIGAFSVAGGYLFGAVGRERETRQASMAGRQVPVGKPMRAVEQPRRSYKNPAVTDELPAFLYDASPEDGEALEPVSVDLQGDEPDADLASFQPAGRAKF
jgi:hypothetical protein